MSIYTYTPGHAKRAGIFQTEVGELIGHYKSLGEKEIFVVADHAEHVLRSNAKIMRMSKKYRIALTQSIYTIDAITADTTGIGIIATCNILDHLTHLLDEMDAIGYTRGVEPHDGSERIFPNEDFDSRSWLLNAVYWFADSN